MAAERFLYGGQAVIEGVMIRGRTQAALAIRKPNGQIGTHRMALAGWSKGRLRRIPLVRGIVVLAETLVVGTRSLTLSANAASQEEDEAPLSSWALGITLAVGVGIGILVFFLFPLLLSHGVEVAGGGPTLANIAEGALRLAIFVGYLWAIGRMSDIRRVFEYHGAEHMTIAAHEAGQPLDVGSIRRYSTAHPRCGTAFLLTVVLVSILFFILIPREPWWLLIGSRVVLVPFIAAVSYEFIRFSGRHQGNWWIRLSNIPNLALQKLTTRQPADDQIEVAIRAIEYAIALDEGRGDEVDAAREAAERVGHEEAADEAELEEEEAVAVEEAPERLT